jgi:hypothetical protein
LDSQKRGLTVQPKWKAGEAELASSKFHARAGKLQTTTRENEGDSSDILIWLEFGVELDIPLHKSVTSRVLTRCKEYTGNSPEIYNCSALSNS